MVRPPPSLRLALVGPHTARRLAAVYPSPMMASRPISHRIPLTWAELVLGAAAVALVGLLLLAGVVRWQGPRLRELACRPEAAAPR